MSWSFYSVGRPLPVLEKARADLGKIKCAEPEETIKNNILSILEASLLVMPETVAVNIAASGSQSPAYSNDGKIIEGKSNNYVKLEVTTLYGFVE